MSDCNYRPSGELQGDTKEIPDRGTGVNVTDTYGADISPTARNRKGGISSATQSDAPDCMFSGHCNTKR
jgi:hypothetical protein